MAEQRVPDNFICPITQEIMKDPVVDKEGHSYERAAITEWLNQQGISPMTRRPMVISDLIPNRALKEIIEATDFSKYAPIEKREESIIGELHQDSTVTFTTVNNSNDLLIKIQTPKGVERTPVDICCVIDISGSMGNDATIKNKEGNVESNGFNILDIVKHAVRTLLATLTAKDSLSLITFSDNAEVVLSSTVMDEQGRENAKKILDTLEPTYSTNLWAGLEKGLDLVRENPSHRLPAVFLFTDGCPNIEPPRGHMPMLRMYKDKHNGLPCLINTFGFGYTLDSQLLNDLAYEGNGSYVFIPDSSFVGTAFINATSNLFSIMAQKAKLSIELLNDCKLIKSNTTPGGLMQKQSSWGTIVDIGSLQYDQSRDIVIKLEDMPAAGVPNVSLKITYEAMPSRELLTVIQESITTPKDVENSELITQLQRTRFVDTISEAMALMTKKKEQDASKLIEELKISVEKEQNVDSRIAALYQDIEGQVTEAFVPKYYAKWGKHYLLSLATAHRQQICNNFKDPGVQVYGGPLFESLRDEIDEIFRKLPAPQKKRSISRSTASAPVYSYAMSSYHSRDNVCFAGSCLVSMADGTVKRVQDIVRGDQVQTINGNTSSVLCVVKSLCANNVAKLVDLGNGLLITEYHPVFVSEKWRFPNEIAEPVERFCDSVYSFVLDVGHVMYVNGTACVSLGHDFTDDVREHSFFGSQQVVDNLKECKGWSNGIVVSRGVYRDERGLICGIAAL